MIELKDWIETTKFKALPWLVLGKGPSFSERHRFNLSAFNTLGLNHVVREQKVFCAHIIDIDVLEACGDKLLTHCDWLIMPQVPHVRCFASEYMNTSDWLNCIPILAEKAKQGKLVTYSLSCEGDSQDPWVIQAKYFSSEAAFGILGRMQVKQINILGIDGGDQYSSLFSDLDKTLLANQQSSFDGQFERLNDIARQFNFQYVHLLKDNLAKIAPSRSADESLAEEAEDVAGITLPLITDLKIGAHSTNLDPQAEFASLPQASEYAASYIYRRKKFPRSAWAKSNNQSAAEKIQILENDLRLYRQRLEETLEELGRVSKDMVVCQQRLGWSRQELIEYRARTQELEKNLSQCTNSVGWKIGRVLAKPAEIIGKCFAKPESHDRR